MEEFSTSDIQFHHPFRIILAGSSGCGKSSWIMNFLRFLRSVADTEFDKIIYVYQVNQPLYEEIKREMPNIIWIRGFPQDLEDRLCNSKEKKLVIFDDVMKQIADNKDFAELATTLSHHLNVSYLATLQNLLYQGSQMRTIHLQTTAYVLFKSPRDVTQVRTLANQIGAVSPQFVKRAYRDATKNKYQYLLLDLHIDTPDALRVRTGVLPGEQLIIFTE